MMYDENDKKRRRHFFMRVLDWTIPKAPCDHLGFSCRYGLLVEDIEVDGFQCESYGVVIADPAGNTKRCRHITVNAAQIAELLDLLIRNGVTPVTLSDVVEDWLGQ